MRTNRNNVTEVASIRTNMELYSSNYDHIFGEKKMSYIDKYGLYNVKPCTNGEPSGNDGLIVSAYAAKVGLVVEDPLPFYEDLKTNGNYPIERLPNKSQPMPSRDFFLGAVFFLCIHPHKFEKLGWNFSPIELPKFNLIELVRQLYKLKGKHRNTFWEEDGYEQVYYTACMAPYTDRAFYYRCHKLKAPFIYRIIEAIDKKLEPSGNSGKLIRFLKYNIKPDVKVFEGYFGGGHPITVKYKESLK